MRSSINSLILITAFITLFLSNCSNIKTSDCKEKQIFLEQLSIIENYFQKDSLDFSFNRARAITFLALITQIESESEFIWEWQLQPTKNDYKNWKKWFEQNEEKLCEEPYKNRIDITYKMVYSL